ncbi:MAG: dihydroorotate dehydrogenase electron transfer subunit [Candidatus Dormibacteraceae bacterium]
MASSRYGPWPSGGGALFESEAPLVSRRQVARDTWVLGFEAHEVAAAARAGQFVNLALPGGPLLRRAFSVYRALDGMVEILLRPVGDGTGILAAMEVGGHVSCLGPLGRGFGLDPSGGPVALLSGGLGAAPMPIAAAEAARLGLPVVWVHGARSAADLSSEWWGDRVVWATVDGSRGHRGSAVEAVPAPTGQVLACGPNPMLAAVAERWPEAQVSIETYMACGTGVCLGCAAPKAGGGYDRACTEGPVYRAADLDWSRLPSPARVAVVG